MTDSTQYFKRLTKETSRGEIGYQVLTYDGCNSSLVSVVGNRLTGLTGCISGTENLSIKPTYHLFVSLYSQAGNKPKKSSMAEDTSESPM